MQSPAVFVSRSDPRQPFVVFEFEEYRLDTGLHTLERNGAAIPIQPRVFALLAYLIQHRRRVVPSSELLATLWRGIDVPPNALHWSVYCARRALGQRKPRQAPIKAVRGVGYQFVTSVRIGSGSGKSPVGTPRQLALAAVAPSDPPAPLEKHVCEVLAQGPGCARFSNEVARALGLRPRAMREQLVVEGVTFFALADDARRQHALRLLASTHVRVEEVATRVGYTRVQNFARAFRRWTGQSPMAYRRRSQGGQARPT
jgi:DNA-binding winged helix-turn-helix (wHTH) protein